MSELALFGGPQAAPKYNEELFHWPRVNEEMEDAVLAVLRSGDMSGIGITRGFEREYARWMGVDYALASPNGTGSLQEAIVRRRRPQRRRTLGHGPRPQRGLCGNVAHPG